MYGPLDLFAYETKTFYALNGNDFQEYTGPITITEEGEHTLSYYSVDQAGNIKEIAEETIPIDKTPPTITGAATTDRSIGGAEIAS